MDFTLYLPATTLAAVLNGALLMAMTTAIALRRRADSISSGDGGDKHFAKRQRGHANGVEQIPIALLLLFLAEVQGAPTPLLWLVVTGLTVGRCATYGSGGPSFSGEAIHGRRPRSAFATRRGDGGRRTAS